MPNSTENNGLGSEKVVHDYTLTSQKMLKKLGLKGSWINSISEENTSFVEDGITKHGKKIHISTTDKIEI